MIENKELEKRKRISKTLKERFQKGELVPWAKGLTKETDERVRKIADDNDRKLRISRTMKEKFQRGEIIPWSKGLTKETDERIRKKAEKLSKTLKDLFKKGKMVVWNKGLTKETDKRIAEMTKKSGITQKEQYKTGKRVCWMKGLTKSDKRIQEQIKNRNAFYLKHPERHPNFILGKKNNKKGMSYIEKLMSQILDFIKVKYIFQKYIIYKKGSGCIKWLDFYLPNHKMVIECDGEYWHQDKSKDDERDEIILEVLGKDWRIEHIPGKEIFQFAQFFGVKHGSAAVTK